MPFYEYQCPHCSHYAEVMQKISDPPLKKCPACGRSGFKRLISAPVFRLKGSGWYETDFKSDQENKRNLLGSDDEPKTAAEAKPETKAEAKAEGKAEAKVEAKPAGKADAKPPGGSPRPARRGTARRTAAPARRRRKAGR